ncbi:MAG TPA: PTS sugar transporter subunit IIC [Candidatus Sulfotelmatobacter sp.]|nr:PTS sugar transporter subunit IIC [Candidatus Sulfotelmatobacter sp.]
MLTAILLTIWAILCIFDILGPTVFLGFRPLIAGTGAGIIVGDINLGMAIGATLELTALGVYTYGGATIPDYQTGAIIGTALAAAGSGTLAGKTAIGLTIGLPAAVLLASLDPIGRFLPTFWIHRADTEAVAGNSTAITWLHWTAFIPWALVRAVPTFLAALALSTKTVQDLQNSIPSGFVTGMTVVGAILPAVGFAMLLKIMPVARYWYMLLIGFVLFAYLKLPLLGIALFALAIAFLYVTLKPQVARREVSISG